MKKHNLVSLAVGSAFAALTLSPAAQAADNPFGTTRLQAGYQLAQADTKMKDGNCGGDKKVAAEKKRDGKCGEAKCGAAKKKAEANCGANKKGETSGDTKQ